jgi:hypothetical protein
MAAGDQTIGQCLGSPLPESEPVPRQHEVLGCGLVKYISRHGQKFIFSVAMKEHISQRVKWPTGCKALSCSQCCSHWLTQFCHAGGEPCFQDE